MMYVTGAKANVDAYQALEDKLCGYPSDAHVHVGGGRHVTVDPNVHGPGWTLHQADPRQHPDRDEWAYPWVGPIAAAMSDPKVSKLLTVMELELLDAAAEKAKDLDKSWDPPTQAQL